MVVDSSRNLISATFFANSGGQTVNSEDVWLTAVPYLRSIQDTFSIGMKGYEWHKEISVQEWKQYLQSKGFSFEPYQTFTPFTIDSSKTPCDSLVYIEDEQSMRDSLYSADSLAIVTIDSCQQYTYDTIWHVKSQINFPIDYTFEQKERKKYFSFRECDTLLRLREIRSDWKLRSTFFTITQNNNTIVFNGKGYGHGVGLSQEGAMRMADLQYTYDQIIKYYFTGVQIMSIQAVRFFQIE